MNIKLETGFKVLLDDNDGHTAIGVVILSEEENI
jgi:hypothetical protein